MPKSDGENRKTNQRSLVSYENMAVEELYVSLKYSSTSHRIYGSILTAEEVACDWVEAENMMAIRLILIEWFDALQDGTANDRYPDPLNMEAPAGKPITQERADLFVEELEEDMLMEKARFRGLKREAGPGYTRLEPHARIAFMQAVWRVMLTPEEIKSEARRRLKKKDLPNDVLENKAPPTQHYDFW